MTGSVNSSCWQPSAANYSGNQWLVSVNCSCWQLSAANYSGNQWLVSVNCSCWQLSAANYSGNQWLVSVNCSCWLLSMATYSRTTNYFFWQLSALFLLTTKCCYLHYRENHWLYLHYRENHWLSLWGAHVANKVFLVTMFLPPQN